MEMLENTRWGASLRMGSVSSSSDDRCVHMRVCSCSFRNVRVSVLIPKPSSVAGRFHRGVPACEG